MGRYCWSIAMVFAICMTQAHAGIVQDGLVANWSFDAASVKGNTMEDLAGAYPATTHGDPKSVAGKYGEAVLFDGQDDYLDLGILEGVGAQLGSYSVEFWLKTEVTQDWTTLFKTLTDGLSMGWGIDLNRTATPAWAYAEGHTHFYIRDQSGLALAPEIEADIYDNAWHHIAWVVADASTDECKIYVDGQDQAILYAYQQTPAAYVDFQHPVYLGAANNRGNTERFCPAAVDELRLYSRALTSTEVQQNMGSGASVENVGKLALTWANLKQQ